MSLRQFAHQNAVLPIMGRAAKLSDSLNMPSRLIARDRCSCGSMLLCQSLDQHHARSQTPVLGKDRCLSGVAFPHWGIRAGRRVPAPNYRAIQDIRSEREKAHPGSAARASNGRAHACRRVGAVGLKLTKSTWLFDAGEDTQRQVHKQPLIRHGKVERIFITNRRASNVLGLPGLLCTMSAARAIGMDTTDIPLHIYGPPGLSDFIRPMLHLSDTYIAMPVVVHEFVEHAVPDEQRDTPELLDSRCCLYRVLIPPDKLNPQGHTKASLEPMLERGTRMTKALMKREDGRLNHRPLNLPPPGDSSASISGHHELQWTLVCEKERSVTALRAKAGVQSFAYILQEADRIGRLNVEAAERHGVFGLQRVDVKAGLSVTNSKGEVIQPEQVCGADIIGRKLAFIGECSDPASLAGACRDADAIILAASCTVTDESGRKQVKSTIEQASVLVKQAKAHHLLLYRFQPESDLRASQAGPSSNGKAANINAFGLNLVESRPMEHRKAPNGYMRRAANTWSSVPPSPESKQAAGEYLTSQLAGTAGYSIPDDMDLYIVERRDISDVPISETQPL